MVCKNWLLRLDPTLGLILAWVWFLLALSPTAALTVEPTAVEPAVQFSGEQALALIEYQCGFGPRYPGSEGIVLLRRAIATHADSLGLAFTSLCFKQDDPYSDNELELCNLIISAGPPGGTRLWLGAHYDTRPFCDRDPDPSRRQEPLMGANDGASGVAVLLHLAEILAAAPPPRGVDLIFFDGEDYGREGDLHAYCLGSVHLARSWQDFGNPLAIGQPEGLILLDMIGKANLSVPMEAYSYQAAPGWTKLVFARALELGLFAFQPIRGQAVYDDHVPFLRAGIPAVDLIDFNFPEWHTTGDLPSLCAAESLTQVGELITDICYRPLVR